MSKGDIFIVDDNPNNLNLLSGILQEHGFEVRLANSGRRTLAAARASPPDLIMLDITMPEMDGYEVCRRLKEEPGTSSIPIIFISALDDAVDKVKAFRVGGADYVTKPFQTEEVIARIENQLKISRLQQALEREKAELIRKNEELIQSQRQTNLVFSALSDALPGTVLDNKYRLERKIGSGGFGTVFQAVQLALDRPVAVKVFRPSRGNDTQEGLERFRREGISACRINHPNAVAVLDSGISSNGIAFLVMELLQGLTLQEELEKYQTLSLQRAVQIIKQVCAVLAEAHILGIVHRDIKPENVFLHQAKDGEIVKVVDFGIAKLLAEEVSQKATRLTMTGNIIGTPVYMAPERMGTNAYDGKSDVYSVGVMLYQMLCGQPPFDFGTGGVVGLMMAHLNEAPPSLRSRNPHIPTEVESIILRAISKNPAVRPHAAELATALTAAVSSSGVKEENGSAHSVTELGNSHNRSDSSELPTLDVKAGGIPSLSKSNPEPSEF